MYSGQQERRDEALSLSLARFNLRPTVLIHFSQREWETHWNVIKETGEKPSAVETREKADSNSYNFSLLSRVWRNRELQSTTNWTTADDTSFLFFFLFEPHPFQSYFITNQSTNIFLSIKYKGPWLLYKEEYFSGREEQHLRFLRYRRRITLGKKIVLYV